MNQSQQIMESLGEVIGKVHHTSTNKKDGVEAKVIEHAKGFNVTLRDIDADEEVGSKIFPKDKLKDAIAYAKSVVSGKTPKGTSARVL
jgi:hypothetical protein